MEAAAVQQQLERHWTEPKGLVTWLTTVDHKRIGVRYLVTASVFFVLAGVAALAMRAQLASADSRLIDPETYNELFTMHGVTMIFLFVTPMLSGFGNYFVPLMLGARDMAFPRLNAFSYWVFLAAGLFIYSSVVVGAMPNDGWFNYVPLSESEFTPDRNIDFYALGLIFLGISTTAGAVNFIVTIFRLRAPGMSLDRMPLFCWAVLATSFAIVFAIPALTAANLLLELERKAGLEFFDPVAGGDPLLWQHLFWIFGHPDVYIIFLPAVGIVSTIVPVFSRRPIVAYRWVVLATILTACIGFGVWVHHMFAVGLPQIAVGFFAAVSLTIAIPSGIQVFAWIATIWTGRPKMASPFLYVVGFVVVFVIGGVTGVMFAVIPFDQQVTDSYFVVAHFHYVLFGGAVFPILAAIHYWTPKITGRLLDERLGRASFWGVFVGFNLTFFPMHVQGLLGMPRRVYTYSHDNGWDVYNAIETGGAFLLALGLALVLWNVLRSLRAGSPAGDDPWEGDTLEWTTSSPPPHYNFTAIRPVRSPHPAWDDRDDRARGGRDRGGDLALAEGHETLAATVLDGDPDEVLRMPAGSPWPLALALALSIVFTGLLIDSEPTTVVGVLASLAALLGWHGVPRPGPAEGPRRAPSGEPSRGRTSGWWGMWLLIATETALFGALVASYLYLRFRAGGPWPPAGIADPALARPVAMTVLLTVGALALLMAVRLSEARRRPALLVTLAVAALAGLGFLGVQVAEYSSALDRFDPDDNAYTSLFFTVTGVHAPHVAIGVLLVGWLIAAAALGAARTGALRCVALYWQFVTVVWLALFAVVYLGPRL